MFPIARQRAIKCLHNRAVEVVAGASRKDAHDHLTWPVRLHSPRLDDVQARHLCAPFAVGIWSAFWLLHHENGFLISIVGGFALAICVLATGQFLFASVRSSAIRLVLVAVFALPAGVAGYNLIYNLGRLGSDPGIGLTILSAVGGLAIALGACRQLTAGPLMTEA